MELSLRFACWKGKKNPRENDLLYLLKFISHSEIHVVRSSLQSNPARH